VLIGLSNYILTWLQVLVLVIKRFCWTSSSRAKVDTQIRFPLKGLDMAPYLYHDTTTNNSVTTSKSETSARYNLRSLIVHHGVRLLSGHYSCYSFNDEKGAWVHFNDTHVTVETPEEVENSQPYMLFYERDDTELANRSQEPISEEDLDVRMLEDLSVEIEEPNEEDKVVIKQHEMKLEEKNAQLETPKKSTKTSKPSSKKQALARTLKTEVKEKQINKEVEDKIAEQSSSDQESKGGSSDNEDTFKPNNNKNTNNSDQDEESSQNERSSAESSESESVQTKNKPKSKVQPKKNTRAKRTKSSAPIRKPAPKNTTNKTASNTKTTGTKRTAKSHNTKAVADTVKKPTAAVTTRSAKKKTATLAIAESKTASNTTKKTRRR